MHSLSVHTMVNRAPWPLGLFLAACCLWAGLGRASENHTADDFNSMPINILEQGVKPRVMINASKDHQLYFKAYNDYSDLDGDGIPETTYKHSFNYYGYFDSYKCYTYDPVDKRFEPRSFTTDKYCTSTAGVDNDATSGEWSGNFLNWVSMSRIDSIRKILFGGHRRIDTATDTTLERSYLPHDAHSWAKHYAGADLAKLTPFRPASSSGPTTLAAGGVEYYCDEGNAISSTGVVNALCKDPADDTSYYDCNLVSTTECSDKNDPYNYNCAEHQSSTSEGYNACKDVSVNDPRYRRNRFAYDPAEDYKDTDWDGTPVDRKKLGVTFGNTTDVTIANYNSANTGSEKYTEPPLIKVTRSNHSLWASNERWQVTWSSGAPMDNHSAGNSNNPAKSLIPAYSNAPSWDSRMGEGNYIARVQACVPGLIDSVEVDAIAGSAKEKCKLYPGPDGVSGLNPATGANDDNYKPVGLLQAYGDDEKMYFGMVTGSYNKHASGGQLIRNAGSFTNEVNVASDGTFPKVAKFASDSSPLSSNANGEGLVNAWSLYRIVRYDGLNGYYNSLDHCSWSLYKYGDITNDNNCQNWGNPFAEIYYQSLNYLAGGGAGGSAIGDYVSIVATGIPGLPTPEAHKDPLKEGDYCAQLSVVNLNSSVISYDHDQLDSNAYGPHKMWDPAVLPGVKNTVAMTNVVGAAEGIHGNSYFVGGANLGTGDDQLCTAKTVGEFGKVLGLCPEAPHQYGSYRIAGLAYYAHTRDIRPDTNSSKLPGDQVVDSYSVALASGAPVIQIPDPENTAGKALATILPACRNTSLGIPGTCAIVDFKIVRQDIDATAKRATGRFYINWEDAEQGGDYDQDMWGTLDYDLDKSAGTLTITTQVHAQSASQVIAFGYVLSGTSDDGFHAHSGINGFKKTEAAASGFPACNDSNGCAQADGPSRKSYTLAASNTKLLEDPLWYAAKWGGFIDQDGNKLPNLVEEWDSKINATGGTGSDGIPDNYYYATNPRQLEDSLERVFKAILERTSAGTAAAIVSSNVRGEGALLQAFYEPLKKSDTQEARWLGTVQALWLDSSGYTRQDCSPPVDGHGFDTVTGKCLASPANLAGGVCTPNGRLDNYCVDQVVETYYDTLEKKTRARIFESNVPRNYSIYSMQGVVRSFSGGAVVMDPNSVEGEAAYANAPETITIKPYSLVGALTAYDPDTGLATMTVSSWSGPSGASYASWGISTSSSGGEGYSVDALAPVAGTDLTFTISPAGAWLNVGDTLTLKTKNLVGDSGEVFSDWDVECLDTGNNAVGRIEGVSKQLNNLSEDSFSMTTVSGDFTGCTRAKVSSYDLKGPAGKIYSQWTVANLGLLAAKGASTTPLFLGNSGTRSFEVTPVVSWLQPGDKVLLSNRNFTTKAMHEISYLWNAREQLYLPSVSDADLAVNRDWNAASSTGRYITTWVDANLDGAIDVDEYRAFDSTMLGTVSHTFFDVGDAATAAKVIDYVRGIESADSRNRTVVYSDTDTAAHVMRLGDVVHSTPTVVRAPQEAFNTLYDDMSYRKFFQQYIRRRVVVYAGGNDGLLHAFNGGFYNEVLENPGTVDEQRYVEYSTTGNTWNGASAVPHPLGGELWAYAPYNLLTHLQWLKDPDYGKWTHVYFMDAKPRVFDAKIFEPDADHPEGWGTVMVAGMNLGGGVMTVNVDHDNNASTAKELVRTRSAYVVFDITNPEVPPRLMAELPMPDGSFTTVVPAVAAFQDVGSGQRCEDGLGAAIACNNWYLLFGNGPNSLDYVSTQNAKFYLFDLGQLRTKTPKPVVGATGLPANCTVQPIQAEANLMVCDTAQANSFMGGPVVVDWGLDFMANTTYFGLIGRETVGSTVQDNGQVMRMGFNNKGEIASWSPLVTFFNTGKPVVGQPVPSTDNRGNHWLFFGTGRYFTSADKATTDAHYLYGVKDKEAGGYPVAASSLLDVSNVNIYTDGSVSPPVVPISGPTLATFSALEAEMDSEALGWKRYLEPIVGDATAPSSRNNTRSTLYGGVLLSTVFQPDSDPCAGQGRSRLFGLYYKTGTGHPKRVVFDITVVPLGSGTKAISNPYVDLGIGQSSTPSVHTGAGPDGDPPRDGSQHEEESGPSGDNARAVTTDDGGGSANTQFSTILKTRSGRTSWQER